MEQSPRGRKPTSFAARKKLLDQQLADDRRIQHRRTLYTPNTQQISNSSSRSRGQRNSLAATQREPTVTTLNAFATENIIHSLPKLKPQRLVVDPVDMGFPNSATNILVPETPLHDYPPITSEPLPSLAKSSEDWKPDGYSNFMTDFRLPTEVSGSASSYRSTPSPEFTVSDYDDSSVPELEDDYDDDCDSSGDSLLEIAQPVSYHLPKVRPSVISIGSRGSSREWTTHPSERELMGDSLVPHARMRLQRRDSTGSLHEGFQACEARPVEVPDYPDTAICTMPTTSPSLMDMSRDQHSSAWNASTSPTTGKKPGHKRLNSIKSIMRSPTLSRTSSLHLVHGGRSSMSRPSTAIADIFDDNYNPFETVPAHLFDPVAPTSNRSPQTDILAPSSNGTHPAFEVPMAAPDSTTGGQFPTTKARRKSMKVLRKRGESIGQAFKMAALMALGNAKADASSEFPPPVPVLPLQQHLIPPPSSSLSLSSSTSSSASLAKVRDPAGLGLYM